LEAAYSPAATGRINGSLFIMFTALGLGIAGDLLLRSWPWGVNGTLWLSALCLAVYVLKWTGVAPGPRPWGSRWLACALALSFSFVIRSSPALLALDGAAVALCLGMVAFRTPSGSVRLAGITDYAFNLALSAIHSVAGASPLLIRGVDWSALIRGERKQWTAAVGRGLLVGVPLAVVFASLFASADVFFADLLSDSIVFSPGEVASHVGLVFFFAWLSASYLWNALLGERREPPNPRIPSWIKFDAIETAVVFGLLNLLFLAFVLVQFRYLFGGAGRVESSSTLTYAQYARRGFFELVAVAALVAPVVLMAHWLLPRGRAGAARLFGVLAGVLVVLLFVVMASALERMRLYQETFGLTELRLYATALLLWLTMLFVWIVATVLRGRRGRFAFGAVVSGLAVVAVLNLINPDGLIVRRNATAANSDHQFDTPYALGLSADAVPSLLAAFDKVPPGDRCRAATELRGSYGRGRGGWRNWNLARWRAERAVASSEAIVGACEQ